MNKIIAKTLILGAIISLNALATEKMTYEQAMESHKNTYGKYSQQSITETQSQQSWDTYKQEPVREGDGNVKNSTVLYENPAGLSSGNFILSESYENFDYLEFYGTTDDTEGGKVYRITPAQIDYLQGLSSKPNAINVWAIDGQRWEGRFSTNKRTFVTGNENSKMHKVVGVNE
ncbi:hypothetical protein [Shewanella frigidimarina]|uniref:hypothetical protein n=1 Tax=Shewanella frigidimarina TaxID=56812 RepID=UPI003D7AA3F2